MLRREDVPIRFPCGADFAAMTSLDRGRLCAACDAVVHDLSGMTETEARTVLASREEGRLCVRYLYDARGRVLFAEDHETVARAQIVPAHRLTARAAMLLAPLVLFEACGGNAGDYDHTLATPEIASTTADDAGDAGPADAADAGDAESD